MRSRVGFQKSSVKNNGLYKSAGLILCWFPANNSFDFTFFECENYTRDVPIFLRVQILFGELSHSKSKMLAFHPSIQY